MARLTFHYLSAAALALSACSAAANPASDFIGGFQAAAEQGQASTRLLIDNDTLLLNDRDGFYTSGGRIVREHWLHGASQSTGFGWHIGQELYTASDIKLAPELISPQDHPYAGWLYGGVFKEVRHSDGHRTKVGIDIGCIGPCAGGEWTQEKLHKILRQPLPQGWSRQVRNEGGLVLHGELAPVRWTPRADVDVVPVVHGRFGNIFTDAGVGVTLRAGRLNQRPNAPTLHALAKVDVAVVGYNATLQGGYFSKGNPHTVDPKRVVGEAEIGIAWIDGPWGISASVVRRSNEIQGLSNSQGAQSYARFVFSYTP